MNKLFKKNIFTFYLALLIAIGFTLRIYNINWDNSMHLHPDERAIVMFALPLAIPSSIDEFLNPQSSLNPNFFAYGNFPLYILKFFSIAASGIDTRLMEYDGIFLVGRFISAAVDTATILLVYKMGSIIFSRKTGVFAALLYTFSVFPIQAAHFFTADTLLTFFITFTLYRLIKLYKNPTILNSFWVGIFFGLSLSTKVSAIPLLIAIFATISIDFWLIFFSKPHHFKTWFPHIPLVFKRLLRDGLIIFSITTLTFLITQPYAIIDYKNFIDQNLLQSQMTHNAYIFPYTLQYVDKIPIIYELKNIFLWGQGVFIFLICFTGIIYAALIFKTTNKNQIAELLVLYTFLTVFFLIVANFAVGWMRYLLPIYPLLSLFGGIFLSNYLFKKIQTFKIIPRYFLISALTIIILIWPLSFINIYNNHPRIEASAWIHNNIPQGSTLAVEHWDDRLPLRDSAGYFFEELALYEQPDDETKWTRINNQISNSDYIILASNRLYTPLQKLSDCDKYLKCYPQTKIYYENLFSDNLGFTKIAEFNVYPKIPILNIEIKDDTADESFTVYDHPKVIIFKNNRL